MSIQESAESAPEAAKATRLVVLDSFYNLCGGELNESSLADISAVYALIRDLAARLHSAIVNVHHFAKGDPGQKMAGDRAAGSRAHRQEPDAYIELVPLKTDRADTYAFEADVRDYPRVEKFGISWRYPLLELVPEVDASEATAPVSRKQRERRKKLLEVLGEQSLTRKAWLDQVTLTFKISSRTFDRDKDEMLEAGDIEADENRNYRRRDTQIEGGTFKTGKAV